MSKTLKILAIIVMAIVVLSASSQMVFGIDLDSVVQGVNDNIQGDTGAATDLTKVAGKVVGLIQIASAVLAVILVAVFGFKFILGSANEKADYQKSFIPLIVGIVVVFAATSIAKLLFGIIA